MLGVGTSCLEAGDLMLGDWGTLASDPCGPKTTKEDPGVGADWIPEKGGPRWLSSLGLSRE